MFGATAGAKTKPVATMGSEIETYVWTERDQYSGNALTSSQAWRGIAVSDDFVKQAAVVSNVRIWGSANSGVFWTEYRCSCQGLVWDRRLS